MFDSAQFFIASAHAQAASPAPSAAGSPASYGMGFLPLILIFLVFYVLLIRPQQKKLDEQNKMIKALSRGDRIITGGGVYGKIVKLEGDDTLVVEIADGVQIKVLRSTVSALAAKTEPVVSKPDDAGGKADKKA